MTVHEAPVINSSRHGGNARPSSRPAGPVFPSKGDAAVAMVDLPCKRSQPVLGQILTISGPMQAAPIRSAGRLSEGSGEGSDVLPQGDDLVLVPERRTHGPDLLREREDLIRELDQLDVLLVLLLHERPLLVGDDLALGVGPVLTDQEKSREKDRLE